MNQGLTENNNRKIWYDKNYKLLLIIPALLLLISIVYLFVFVQNTGDIIRKDVSLTGGTSITVFDKDINLNDLKSVFKTPITTWFFQIFVSLNVTGPQILALLLLYQLGS